MQQKNGFIKREILPYFIPYKNMIYIGCISILGSTALSLWLPLFIQKIINDVSNVKAIQIIIVLLIVFSSLLLESLSTYVFAISGQKVVRDIRNKAWTNVLLLKSEEFDHKHSGEFSSRIMNDSAAIISFLSSDLPGVIIGMVTILASIAIMFYLDFVMTSVFLCLTPLIIFTIKPISNRILLLSEKMQTLLADINSFFTEIISQNKLVKSHNAEQFEQERGTAKIEEMYLFGRHVSVVQAILNPLMGSIITILVISVIGVGTYRTSVGYIAPGTLVAFILYFFQIIQPIQSIGSFFIESEAVKGTTGELLNLTKMSGEKLYDGDEILVADNLTFKDICFSYNKLDIVLDDFNCLIEKGKKTAIVGESGAGKTTIFSLLEKFYYPQKGIILIGNRDIRDISLTSWRRMFGYVSQDNVVISGTLKENIMYGLNREVLEEELMSVIKDANLEDFVNQLPEKLDYFIGERGNLLSGGQKQRIVIARALLRNPQYLLLDEATANLDSDSERIVQVALHNLLEGRTAIIIAHRLSSILNADKIVVLQKGKVSGEGTHVELYNSCAYYKKIVNQQFPELLVEKEVK